MRLPLLFLLIAAVIACSGCGGQEEPAGTTGKGTQGPPAEEKPAAKSYTETGDLDALKKRGQLRILMQKYPDEYLPREGDPLEHERELATAFARSVGLVPVICCVQRFQDLIPALLGGKGDVIAANLTVTEGREKQLAFTVPLGRSTEQVVSRAGEKKLKQRSDLNGRTLAVQKGTSFRQTAQALQKSCPELRIQALPGHLVDDDILDRVARKKIDLTIEDSNILDVICDYRDDIKPFLDVSPKRPLAWGVRPSNPALLAALNRYLNETKLTLPRRPIHKDDLPGIKKRKVLRVLARNNSASYFLWRGRLMGFEYELAKEFAKRQGLRLEMIVPQGDEDLLKMLVEGRGDIAADFLTPTDARRAMGIEFSRPYHYAPEVVVSRADDKVAERKDLAGRTVVVRKTSSHWGMLEKLKAKGTALKLQAAPESMETEEIVAKVADGTYDLTVTDGEIADLELAWRSDIKKAFALGEPEPHAWAVRAGNKQLLAAVDAFFKKEYRSTFYNMTFRKYFKSPRRIEAFKKERACLNEKGEISPYDKLVKKYAEEYEFDWRLIVAQMYQESRFNPKVKSSVGAQGLMQVMPRTAHELGFKSLTDPASGIDAGVKYLAQMRDRLDPKLPVKDRAWFALASYNAGLGHVVDARRLAGQMGRDADRWFDNVEQAMLLLAKPQYAKKARHGYVRGQEPVKYVRDIRTRYRAYVCLTTE